MIEHEWKVGDRVECLDRKYDGYFGKVGTITVDYGCGLWEVAFDDGVRLSHFSREMKLISGTETTKPTLAELDAEIEEIFGRIRDLIGKLA